MKKSRERHFVRVASIMLALGAIMLSAPNSTRALTMDSFLIYTQGSLALPSNGSDDIYGNVYAGGSISGDATDTIHGNATAGGSITPALIVTGTETKGATSTSLDSINTILTTLGNLGYNYTTISGSTTFTSATPAGVYYVTGSVVFSSGATGNWTIISGGSWSGGGSGSTITSYIYNADLFPNGLTGYAGGSMANLGNIYGALAAVGSITFSANSDVKPDPPAVHEPSTLILLGLGLLGVAGVYRKKFKK